MREARWDADNGKWRCPHCGATLDPNDYCRIISPCWACKKACAEPREYQDAERLRRGVFVSMVPED